ncbi:unnamed protein product, partial [Amoebophrya sp. A120]
STFVPGRSPAPTIEGRGWGRVALRVGGPFIPATELGGHSRPLVAKNEAGGVGGSRAAKRQRKRIALRATKDAGTRRRVGRCRLRFRYLGKLAAPVGAPKGAAGGFFASSFIKTAETARGKAAKQRARLLAHRERALRKKGKKGEPCATRPTRRRRAAWGRAIAAVLGEGLCPLSTVLERARAEAPRKTRHTATP